VDRKNCIISFLVSEDSLFILHLLTLKKGGRRMAYRIGKCLLSDKLEELDMTPAELARRLGVHRQQIDKWVNDKSTMTMESAKNVATILGLEHGDQLYEWVPTRKKA
jgi:transcriptional regulator with XRE-family HTH domain